jgi:glycerate 2-kinase
MSHVVVAPDKFKGTLTAAQVAGHVAAGLERARPGTGVVQVPVADGGDGTVEAAEAAGYRRVEMGVRGPTGKAITAAFAFAEGTAVIEAAAACGLTLLPAGELAPLTAHSRGVGELILAAARMRAKRIVLGLGGVATTDGGSGMVRAFGARPLDSSASELPSGGGALARLDHLDLSQLRDLSGIEFVAASDVDNPLLGPHGAAAVYGPQKGATPADVAVLEAGLARWADVVEQALAKGSPPGASPAGASPAGASPADASPIDASTATAGIVRYRDMPGAGAAGGLGFAALAFLGATFRPGIDLMLDLVSFGSHLDNARLVITGEGALDTQTLHGKAPVGVARAAAVPGVPVVAVCGTCSLTPAGLAAAGISQAYALTDIEPDVERCRANPGPLLEALAAQIAADWLT